MHPEIVKRGTWGNIHIATRDYNMILIVEGVESPEQAGDVIEIRHRTESEIVDQLFQARLAALDETIRARVTAATDTCQRENDALRTELDTQLAEEQKHLARLQQQGHGCRYARQGAPRAHRDASSAQRAATTGSRR